MSVNTIFIEKPSNKELLKPLQDYFKRTFTRYKGEVGMELEFEGNKFPKSQYEFDEEEGQHLEGDFCTEGWQYHKDHSLRGDDNAEYVFDGPVSFAEAEKRVHRIFSDLEGYGTVLDESHRTSMHVHLNVQGFTIPEIATLCSLYFTFEELLIAWCGDRRQGNLFCLSGADAPGIVSDLRRFLQSEGSYRNNVPRDNNHYAALNANAIGVFGSLEFRSMRGVSSPAEAMSWLNLLERLYRAVGLFSKPTEVCEMFSGYGGEQMLVKIFGEDLSQSLIDGSGLSRADIDTLVRKGIRIAQTLAYCRDWDKFTNDPAAVDVFGREKTDPCAAVNVFSSVSPADVQLYHGTTIESIAWPIDFGDTE